MKTLSVVFVFSTLLWNDCLCWIIDGFIVAGAIGFGVGFGWIGTGWETTDGTCVVWIAGIEANCRIWCCKPVGTWATCCSV